MAFTSIIALKDANNSRKPSYAFRRSPSRSSSRASSYDYGYPPSSSRSTHSSRTSLTSLTSSAGSSYSRMSTSTFGDRSRPGYAPGQAPPDYFYNDAARDAWDNARVDEYGRRVRSSSSRGLRPVLEDDYGSAREHDYGVPSERRGRFSEYSRWRDEDGDNETVRPWDSISQASYQSSGRRSRRSESMGGIDLARDYYAPSRYSQGYGREDSRFGDMDGRSRIYGGEGSRFDYMDVRSRGSSRGGGPVHVANGRLVRIEEPDW